MVSFPKWALGLGEGGGVLLRKQADSEGLLLTWAFRHLLHDQWTC